jgi:hypothetical protein
LVVEDHLWAQQDEELPHMDFSSAFIFHSMTLPIFHQTSTCFSSQLLRFTQPMKTSPMDFSGFRMLGFGWESGY